MSQETFKTLITDYCELVGIKNPKLILDGHPVRVGGVLFSIFHEATNPDYALIYCDLGTIADLYRSKVERMVLEANSTLYMMNGCCLTKSDKGHIVLATHVPLENLSAQQFCDFLESQKKSIHNLWSKIPGVTVQATTGHQ